ncbi:25548_t:CDS:2, partial [Gigaspora margarita]
MSRKFFDIFQNIEQFLSHIKLLLLIMSVNEANISELELLRQRIRELEAENAEIPDLRKKLAEIPELRKKLAEVEARNAELIKQIMEENNRCDAKIEDTNDRVAKLEQLQNDNTPNDNTPNNNSSNFNSEKMSQDLTQPCNSTSSEEKICSELDSKCKKGKGVNKLKQELFAPELPSQVPIEQNHVTKISETAGPGKSSIDEASQHLAQLCDKAFDAEDGANRANQEEILCWCLYAKDFRTQLNEIIENSDEEQIDSPANTSQDISSEKIPEVLQSVSNHVTKISETAGPGKNLPEVNTPSTSQITPAKANDNDLTDLKEEDFCGGE